jgi:hypothetical protein
LTELARAVTSDELLGAPFDPTVADSPATDFVKGAFGPPAVVDPAQVFGRVIVGDTLIGERPTFTGLPAAAEFTNQWQSRPDAGQPWQDIVGANGLTFEIPPDALGLQLRFEVIADDGEGGGVTGASSATSPVSIPPRLVTAPSVSGTSKVGSLLTLDQGAWSGDPVPAVSQHWKRCAGASRSVIRGTRATTYRLTAADVGLTVRARVFAANIGGTASTLSNTVGPISP